MTVQCIEGHLKWFHFLEIDFEIVNRFKIILFLFQTNKMS